MRRRPFLLCLLVLFAGGRARAEAREDAAPSSRGDLFPRPGRPTVAAATGVPFLGIAEAGFGITNGFALTVVGGVTPSVWTAGLRPRFRIATTERTGLVLVTPLLFYPSATAPGPGGIGRTSWVLGRAELFFDGAIGGRWRLAGGVGLIAAGSTRAIGKFLAGDEFALPAYDGSPGATKGFAGGVWNTLATRASYAIDSDTHVFGEGSLVMAGVTPADDVGGPPVVVTLGLQRSL